MLINTFQGYFLLCILSLYYTLQALQWFVKITSSGKSFLFDVFLNNNDLSQSVKVPSCKLTQGPELVEDADDACSQAGSESSMITLA